MRKPKMEVIRFIENDIVAASSLNQPLSFTLSKFGNGVGGDGIATYNSQDYTLSSSTDVENFLGVIGKYTAGISATSGGAGQSLRNTLKTEANAQGTGAGGAWNGTYVYNEDATWTAGEKTYRGVFYKQ